MKEDLDRLLAYRNFLAAEDHLDELLYSPASSEEESFLTGLKNEIEFLRDDVMPKEDNKEFHCIVKHLSVAYEACREVAKATHHELDINRANACRGLLTTVLERLWGRKVVTCERCGVKDGPRAIQDEDTGDSTEAIIDGLTGGSLQGDGGYRIYGVSGGKTGHASGDKALGIERDFEAEEDGAPF